MNKNKNTQIVVFMMFIKIRYSINSQIIVFCKAPDEQFKL